MSCQLVVVEPPAVEAADSPAALLRGVTEAVVLASHRLSLVFVLPHAKLSLIDCLAAESTSEAETAAHLHALGCKPVWRRSHKRDPLDHVLLMRTLRSAIRSCMSDAEARREIGKVEAPAVLLLLSTVSRAVSKPTTGTEAAVDSPRTSEPLEDESQQPGRIMKKPNLDQRRQPRRKMMNERDSDPCKNAVRDPSADRALSRGGRSLPKEGGSFGKAVRLGPAESAFGVAATS
ncbi:MAG: hypothetical protein SGPRY_001992 [Prymnesium sp.]